MRSLEEILRSYNIVNSRAASRYTIRFTAIVALSGVFLVAAAMLLTGGPEHARLPSGHSFAEDGTGEGSDGTTGHGIDPQEITTLAGDGWVYIGYPLAGYDAAQADAYDKDALDRAVVEWLAANPTTPTVGTPEPVHDPQGDGVLMGYMLHTLDDPTG